MRVKVGDKVYDGRKEPVMIILAPQDKENIKNMASDAFRYCSFPEGKSEKEIAAWMDDI